MVTVLLGTHADTYNTFQSKYNVDASCLQVLDYAWYLPYNGSHAVVTPGVATVAACAALCTDDCQFFTYDYRQQACTVKNYVAPVLTG